MVFRVRFMEIQSTRKPCILVMDYKLRTCLRIIMVVARSLRLPHCMEKIHAADVLIWDEAAMSSRRIFELVNAIHHALSDEPHRRKPFGGKQ